VIQPKSILSGLDEVQKQAAAHVDGPMVVFAGAGSGKTRIITYRIAYLLERGVPPQSILAVTFTNKAAAEMRSRVETLTPLGSRCHISTFHSACARWLREFAQELGYTSDFTIYDENDSLSALKAVLNDLNIKLDDETTVKTYRAAINAVKTKAFLPNDNRLAEEYSYLLPPVGLQVYRKYQEYLCQCNAMDFGDLIMNILLLFRYNNRVREALQNKYKYILVDEYQDTNRAQFELIATLVDKHQNLFVVGDDDQSIYSWRGALPSNIIDFDSVYAKSKKITLEQNYRCSATIVDAAREMISKNKVRVAKKLYTQNPPGDSIDLCIEDDNELEAWWIVDRIKSQIAHFTFDKIAIFYRTNSQSRMLEDTLLRANIPYQIYGTVRFYDRAEIKDLIAYLRVLINPQDDVSAKRIFNVPTRGLGKKAEETVELEAVKRGLPFLKTLQQMVTENHPKASPKIAEFLKLLESLKHSILSLPLEKTIETLVSKTKYADYIAKKHADQAQDKLENIHELGSALADFGEQNPQATIAEWMQTVTLSSLSEGQKGGISLMTLHMAKGLEFDRVYIAGLEEGLLPHRSNLGNDAALEEERRLLYVGMTRAKVKLSLLASKKRRQYAQWTSNRPSRFLTEIPSRYMNQIETASTQITYSIDDSCTTSHNSTTNHLYLGKKVKHPTYGRGVIEDIVLELGHQKLMVRFQDWGPRKVLAHHLE
jgi:DNA helicase-2/ATP-dependent DNA helicase PcrA